MLFTLVCTNGSWVEKKGFCHYLFGDNIVQNGADKIFLKFNFNDYPQKSQIYRWAHRIWATGSASKLNKKAETPKSDRKLSLRTPDNKNAVRESVGRSPKRFFRRCSQELGLSCASVQKILIKNLHLYTCGIKQNFVSAGKENGLWFAGGLRTRLKRILNTLMMFDSMIFYGRFNTAMYYWTYKP